MLEDNCTKKYENEDLNFKIKNKQKKLYKEATYSRFSRLSLLLILPIIILLLLFCLFTMQCKLMYFPQNFIFKIPIYKDIKMGNNNLTIHIIDKNSSVDLIWLYANALNIQEYEFCCRRNSLKLDCNLIIPFYRGFGTSRGSPDDISIMSDMTILSRVLARRKTKKFIYGHSLGCASALFLNKLMRKEGLILENPFYNMKNAVKNVFFVKYFRFLVTQKWENNKRIILADKVLFLVGRLDRLILPENTDMLIENCKKYKKVLIRNANHWDACFRDKNYFTYFNDFMANIVNNQQF